MVDNKYDSSGLPTTYLFLTVNIFAIFLILFRIMLGRQSTFKCLVPNCSCGYHYQKQKNNYILLSLLIILFSILTRNVHIIKMKKLIDGYNPYSILNLDDGISDQKEVKKAYRRLFKKFSREMMTSHSQSQKALIEKSIIDLNAAYEFIKNPASYDKWISEQTKSEFLIAVPSIIFNSPYLIVVLALLFFMAIMALIFHIYTMHKTKDEKGVYFKTTENFNDDIFLFEQTSSEIARVEILAYLSRCSDIKDFNFSINVDSFIKFFESKYRVPVIEKTPEFCALLSFIYRTNYLQPNQESSLQAKIISILDNFIKVTLVQRPALFFNLFDIQRMFVQAIRSPDHVLLQFPHMDAANIDAVVQSDASSPLNIKISLENSIYDASCLKQAISICENIPLVTIKDLIAYSVEDSYMSKSNNLFCVDSAMNSYVEFTVDVLNSSGSSYFVHAPYITRPFLFIAFLVIDKKIQRPLYKIYSFPSKIKLCLPEFTGTKNIDVRVYSNDYLGFDATERIGIRSSLKLFQSENNK